MWLTTSPSNIDLTKVAGRLKLVRVRTLTAKRKGLRRQGSLAWVHTQC